MKINKKILLSIVLVLIASIGFGCSNGNSSAQKKNIDKFINKRSGLYREEKAISDSFSSSQTLEIEEGDEYSKEALEQYNKEKAAIESGEIKLGEMLKDIEDLLTEREYERLIANRFLLDEDLIEGNYDKSEIKDIQYEKISEDEEKAVYKVTHTENLYFENEIKEEKNHTNEFTLEKIDNKWLISHIE